jgi:hypothetical protein
MANQPRKPWAAWILGIAVAASIAWAIAQYLHFNPPVQTTDTEVQLQPSGSLERSSSIVLAETGVRSGTSVDALDGAFTVRIDQVVGATVNLTVSATTKDVYRFKKAEAGRRLVIPAPDATYYLDVLRIRGNVVYLTMSRQ